MAASDLTTLSAVKTLLALTDTSQDAAITNAIPAASAAIRDFTNRSFGLPVATETRTYAYDRSGWLEIDDASAVTAVTLDANTLTVNFDYVLGPDRGLMVPDADRIYEWLELRPGIGISPEMGFTYNLDTIWRFPFTAPYSSVMVTATFGWADVPAPVVQAVNWTVVDFISTPQSYDDVTIATFSVRQPSAIANGIPLRAQDLLTPYRRYS